MLADYRTVGLSLRVCVRNHPLAFWRTTLKQSRVVAACEGWLHCPWENFCVVAGLVLVRQRPGDGQRHHVRHPGRRNGRGQSDRSSGHLAAISRRRPRIGRHAIAHGRLERQGLVIHIYILVNKLEDLKVITEIRLPSQSRDFVR